MKNCIQILIVLFLVTPNSLYAQSKGDIVANTNQALPASYNFQEYVYAEPDDGGDCSGVLNATAELKGIFFAQTHRHEISHPFFFIIGHRPALFQIAIEGSGPSPDVQIEGISGGNSIGTLCLKGPANLISNMNLSTPSFEDYFSVTIPKSWITQDLSLQLTIGDQVQTISQEELKIGPYTELNLVEMKMDVMDYNTETHRFPKFENFLEEVASAIPVSVVRYGQFPVIVDYPEVIASNDDSELVRLKSKFTKAAQGVSSDGSINSIAVLSLASLHGATGDFLSTVYFGNTMNLDPGGWGGGNSFVSPDFTDVFIHELGHALNLPHWGEGPYGNTDANMYEYNYPYGSADSPGGGRGEAWNFNQDLYEFIDPICQYDARGVAGVESSDAMQRNNHCLEKRSAGQGPWDGFGDFSAYAMHRYFVGDPLVKKGTVNYKGEDVPYQFRFETGFPTVELEGGKRVYKRAQPVEPNFGHFLEEVDLPGEEKLNTDVYLIYGTIHPADEVANITYRPIKYNGTLPPQVDPTDAATFETLKEEQFSRLGLRDITFKLTYVDGSIKHVLNPYHSFARQPYEDNLGIFRYDLNNFALVVPADKELLKVETYTRPFCSFPSGDTRLGNINAPSNGITAANFMDEAVWRSEYVFGSEKVLGPNSIGNRVWNDLNRNGVDDAGEPGIEGVSLIMWRDSDGDDIPDSQGFAGFAKTDADGKYQFPASPGNFIVFVWSVDNWDEGEPLHNMLSIEGMADPNNDINGDDNGRKGGFPGLSDFDIASGIITITADGEPLNDGDEEHYWFDYDAAGNQTIDFGFYSPAGCPTLNVNVEGTQVLCDEGLGSILLSPTEGQGPYEYVWQDGQTVSDLENLAAGTYEVTFTDAQSCQGTLSIEIKANEPLQVVFNGPDSLCAGVSTLLDLEISGGEEPYSVVSSSGSLEEFEIGNYTFTVTDNNGCSAEFEKMITEASQASCISSTDDMATVSINFAPNPFSDELFIVNPTAEKLTIQFFSITGQKLSEDVLSPGRNALSTARIQPGVLISTVKNKYGEIVSVKRLVKLR